MPSTQENDKTVKQHSKNKKHTVILQTPIGSIIHTKTSTSETGRAVFDKFVQCIGLDEFWYFSLQAQILDPKRKHSKPTWMSMEKMIRDQNIVKSPEMRLAFKCRFYPDDIDRVYFQLTRRLLLCHMVEELRTNAIYSPPELHLIMLSFAAQAFYGNYNEKKYRPEQLHDLIGHTDNMQKVRMNIHQYEKLLVSLYRRRYGINRSEATEIFLRMVSDLDQYGSAICHVYSVMKAEMGVMFDAAGIKFFTRSNSITPKVAFHWGEICSVSATASQISLHFFKDNQCVHLRTEQVGITRWLFTEVTAYQCMYQRNMQVESRDMKDIRMRATEHKIPGNDTSITLLDAKKEEKDFINRTQEKLKPYDKNYMKDFGDFKTAEFSRKMAELKIEELTYRVNEAKRKYEDSVHTEDFIDRFTKLGQHHMATLARTQHDHRKVIDGALNHYRQESHRLDREIEMIDDLRVAEEYAKQNLRKYQTNENLWLLTPDLTTLDNSEEIVYEFPSNARKLQMPWQSKEPFCITDPNIKGEMETLHTDFGKQIGDRFQMREADANYYRAYDSGMNKYRSFRQLVQINLSTRIQAVLNWTNQDSRPSSMTSNDMGVPNAQHNGETNGDDGSRNDSLVNGGDGTSNGADGISNGAAGSSNGAAGSSNGDLS